MSADPLIRSVTEPVAPQAAQGAGRPQQAGAGEFAKELAAAAGSSGKVQFSKHALARLERRTIPFGPQQLQRLEAGVERAAEKGARQSVVVVDQTAFVVSVANRTVLTAIPNKAAAAQVFTNIDSAVLA